MKSEYEYETLRDIYLFDALGATLRKKPQEYYPKYPSWAEFADRKPKRAQRRGKRNSFDEIVGGIIAKL